MVSTMADRCHYTLHKGKGSERDLNLYKNLSRPKANQQIENERKKLEILPPLSTAFPAVYLSHRQKLFLAEKGFFGNANGA